MGRTLSGRCRRRHHLPPVPPSARQVIGDRRVRDVPRRPGDVDDRRHAAGGRPGQACVRHHRQRVRPRPARTRRVHAGAAAPAVHRIGGRSLRPSTCRGRSPSRWRSASRCCSASTPRRSPTSAVPIFGLAALFGTVRAFGVPAMRSIPPLIAPDGGLPRLIALYSATWQFGMIVGPASSGLLYDDRPCRALHRPRRSAPALGAIATLAIRYRRPQERTPSDQAPTLHHALEGLRFIRRRPILLGAISLDLFAVLFGGAMALLPAIAEDRLHVGNIGYGWLRAAPGVGAVIVSALLAIRPVRRRVGTVLFVAVAVFGAMTVVLGVTDSYVVAFSPSSCSPPPTRSACSSGRRSCRWRRRITCAAGSRPSRTCSSGRPTSSAPSRAASPRRCSVSARPSCSAAWRRWQSPRCGRRWFPELRHVDTFDDADRRRPRARRRRCEASRRRERCSTTNCRSGSCASISARHRRRCRPTEEPRHP